VPACKLGGRFVCCEEQSWVRRLSVQVTDAIGATRRFLNAGSKC